MMEYRQTLINLTTPLGYKEYPTNEPNVGLRMENLFMARLGGALDSKIKKRFSRLLFGIADNW
jgi:acetoin utilization protein AcuA